MAITMTVSRPGTTTYGASATAARALDTIADVRRSLELNVHPGLALEALFHRLVQARESTPQGV